MCTYYFLATEKYQTLCDEIDRELYPTPPCSSSWSQTELGVERKVFPDGERYLRLSDGVNGLDIVLVGGTISDEDTLELYDLACTVVDQGARSLTLLVPYYGYSTMERAVKPGECVTAKHRARLLSSIPRARLGNRIALLDLHSEGLPYYFEGNLRAFHVYGKGLVIDAVRQIMTENTVLEKPVRNYVLASTDAGRAKWVESLANDIGIPAAFVYKRRLSGDKTEITGVNADVSDAHVIIYDDMIRTGGSLLQAARAYKEAGARFVSAIATHGIFPGDSLAKLTDGTFRRLAVTDSHPRAVALMHQMGLPEHRYEVRSTAPLFADFLREHPVMD